MTGKVPERVVTVGSFDGVHRGHHAVVEEIAARARLAGRQSLLVTFEPHPIEVVRPAMAPRRLTTAAERLEALATTALDAVAVLRFDDALRAMSAEAFVREVLLGRFGMRELVIGEDHGLGRGRAGDVEVLRQLGSALGFGVDVVRPVLDPSGEAVSSTRIREAVAAGRLDEAAGWLGRRYAVSAGVVRGAGRGRTLGFPTANLAVPPEKQLPPEGVYAVRVEWRGGQALGMLNQGPRPTVGSATPTLEVHLFDTTADRYGAWLRVEWVGWLRAIRRFDSLDALQGQLREDRRHALTRLARQ